MLSDVICDLLQAFECLVTLVFLIKLFYIILRIILSLEIENGKYREKRNEESREYCDESSEDGSSNLGREHASQTLHCG